MLYFYRNKVTENSATKLRKNKERYVLFNYAYRGAVPFKYNDGTPPEYLYSQSLLSSIDVIPPGLKYSQ